MPDEVPENVQEQFNEAVAFVVVLDLYTTFDGVESLDVLHEMLGQYQQVITRTMEAYPSLEPTTEGFNPATIVRANFEEKGILETYLQVDDSLELIEDWCAQHNEPIELEPTLEVDRTKG